MAKHHRFQVTRVPEIALQPATPIIHVENEIPLPPPLPTNIIRSILKSKSFDTRRRATISAALATEKHQLRKSTSIDVLQNFEPIDENDESDVYSSIQSNGSDVGRSKNTNKFLHELRLKRRELREKAKNFTIDQRISFLRRENQRQILRAQDIFAVHFESHDDNEPSLSLKPTKLFTEEVQEQIRTDIYKELDRQRSKQFDKHYRHLILGRTLLVFMTLLITFMSLTLICVVVDIYDRAKTLDFTLPDNEYLPISKPQLKDYYLNL